MSIPATMNLTRALRSIDGRRGEAHSEQHCQATKATRQVNICVFIAASSWCSLLANEERRGAD
jgi:hypothetical protein